MSAGRSTIAGARVLVVGGTGGIGRAVAAAARDRGAAVVVASRSASAVARTAEALGVAGRVLDVTDAAAVEACFAGVGALDHLVFAMGDELAQGPVSSFDLDSARAFFEVRLFRMFDAVRAALRSLGSAGSITMTTAATAYRGGPGRLLAASVAGAVVSATRSLAVELAPIRVNAVAAGVVRTPLWDGMPAERRERLFEQIAGESLTGRIVEPDEIALAYVGLMELAQVTGQVLVVDGGTLLT